MLMRVSRNTPDYIYRMETGRKSFEINARRRASAYKKDLLEMKEERWLLNFPREEVKGIVNRVPSKLGRELEAALKGVGDGVSLRLVFDRKDNERVLRKMEEGIKLGLTRKDREIGKRLISQFSANTMGN